MKLDFTKEQILLLQVAVELKIGSLKRGQKTASPDFEKVYKDTLARHNDVLAVLNAGGV